ncbi:MAG TPA: peptide chain release factor N(5)-glutamine methyltransferase [Longilinea sp.]|nr:peptide chain release factor N(5)-glutamine methyltransferase [Longilinea sp.]
MATQDSYNELLQKLVANWNGLPDKPDETPETTLRALWTYAAQKNEHQGQMEGDFATLEPNSIAILSKLVDQRLAGTPLAYLTGRQTYLGVDFLASPDAMIPRKETELLGQSALERAKLLASERGKLRGMDLCTGSGNVVLALLHYIPEYQAVAADISTNAVGLAERNARMLGLEKRVNFFAGDLFEPFAGADFEHAFDLITCNPPYIATANAEKMAFEISQFEPREAFDGGPFGVKVIMRLIRESPRFLKPASWLVFEVGLGQGEGLQRIIEKSADFQKVENRTGDNGQIRVLLAQSL